MRRTGHTLVTFLFSLVFLNPAASADPQALPDGESTIEVSVRIGQLTVRTKNALLVDVLRSVGREAGFATVFLGDFTGQYGSWSLTDISLSDGIRQLVGGNGMTIVSDTTGDEHDITKLFVYAEEANTPDDSQSNRPVRVERQSRYLELSQDGPSPERLRAIERLAGLNDRDVVERLETALQSDASPPVRKRAVIALEDIGGDPAVNALETGLGDDNPAIRSAVVSSLGRIGSERAIMAIGQTIIGDPDPETRRAAVLALAGHEGGSVDAFLEAAEKDSAVLVREAAGLLLNR